MAQITQLKPAYVWGALSNTEPPDDDEEVVGYYGAGDSAPTPYIDGKPVTLTRVLPPVPSNAWDWCAALKDYEPGDPQGFGATEQEALDDLMDKMGGVLVIGRDVEAA